MKMDERGALPVLVVFFIMVGVTTGFMKGAEHVDREIINKERYKTQEPNFVGENREWIPKFSEELKIETNAKHDAHGLPPGLTVDTNYVAQEVQA